MWSGTYWPPGSGNTICYIHNCLRKVNSQSVCEADRVIEIEMDSISLVQPWRERHRINRHQCVHSDLLRGYGHSAGRVLRRWSWRNHENQFGAMRLTEFPEGSLSVARLPSDWLANSLQVHSRYDPSRWLPARCKTCRPSRSVRRSRDVDGS